MALVDRYKEQVEAFAAARLRPYLEVVRGPGWRVPAAKELNDCVWQTVVLQPFEVIVLDCPLLQRLRYVKQLGVAHWTYPGAAHSRFEHSVGVVQQLHRLVESLRQKASSGTSEAVPKPAWINLLRFAAICHDIGHGAMSHVVENAFKRLGSLDDLALDLAAELEVEEVKLSEAAAYFLIGSPAFRELVEYARHRTLHELPLDVIDPMRNAILGRPMHDRYPLLQELINGPFDADKLDYITRDAQMAGVPVVTDIPRLVQKVRSVEVERSRLPPAVGKRVTARHPSYVLYGVALSGGRTLDELMFGRTLLFDKIYRHQKVRATEAMVGSIIEMLVTSAGDCAAILPLLFEDDDLLDINRDGLALGFGRPIGDVEWEGLGPARDLASRLKDRRLFVRAYAFAQAMPLDPFRFDEGQRVGLERLLRDSPKPELRKEIAQHIVDQLRRMRAAVPTAWPAQLDSALQFYVVVDPPDSRGHPKEISRAYLVTDDQQVVPFREESAESPSWAQAYVMTRDLGYIFCPPELATATFLAAEIVFRQRFNVRTPTSAQQYAKVQSDALQQLRRQLTTSGFYDELPHDLRAEPERLRNADVEIRITSIVHRLGSYEGLAPVSAPGHKRSVRVDSTRVHTWLRQFQTDQEVDTALSWLEQLKIVTRQDVNDAIRAFIGAHPQFRGAYVCPFGSPKDSSFIVTYYVADQLREYEFRPATLLEALASGDGKPILFVDDFISSGGQARTIVCTWMGDQAHGPLDEDHGPPLAEALRAEIRARQIGFLFVAGEDAGRSALLEEATRLQLRPTALIYLSASLLPRAFSTSAERRDPVRDRAREIGRQLLSSGPKQRTPEWIAERSLGYGNNGYLLLFPYNTPAQALTLLWCDGMVDSWRWLPLFPRRAKD